jgi:hypothetical protein
MSGSGWYNLEMQLGYDAREVSEVFGSLWILCV